MKEWKFYPMAMHLHCGHQPKASMESHIYNAASLGMEYIRFTPHDTRTGPVKYAVRTFDFTQGQAVYVDESGTSRGWKLAGDADVAFDGEQMSLELNALQEGGLCGGSATFYSDGKRQAVSLLADVMLTVGLDTQTAGDAWVILDIEMSQRPPDHKPAHLFYCICTETAGKKNIEPHIPEESIPPHTALIPLVPDEDGLYRLRISEDAKRAGEQVGGLDNAFLLFHTRVMARKGGSVCCRVHKLEIEVLRGFEEVIARQRRLGDEIGARYGVKPFITTEISGAGAHKNYYSEAVPVIDYAARGYQVTQMQAIAHVQSYDGIFCYNHPFYNGRFNRTIYNPEELRRIVETEAASLVASRVYGATLIEVGFPEGRGKERQFSLAEHLRLWDILSLAGVFVTGCGDSDSHDSEKDWFDGNNFVTWIAADQSLKFPVADEEFIKSMKAGCAYTGDPVWLKGEVEFTAEGEVPMGGIISVEDRDRQPRTMTFRAESLKRDWRVRVVVDGELAAEYVVAEAGAFQCSFSVVAARTVSFARVEMYNAEGRCILLTNPIYLVRIAEYAGELPACRIKRN